jgi:hypothetical protein
MRSTAIICCLAVIVLANLVWHIAGGPPAFLDTELLLELRRLVVVEDVRSSPTPAQTPATPVDSKKAKDTKVKRAKTQHSKERTKKFSDIHRSNAWESGESRSGWGSELNYTTDVRGFLSQVLVNYSVQSMLDAPCGDVNWQSSIGELAKGQIQYVGVDIVPDLIERNKAKFAGKDHMAFEVMDLAGDDLDRSFG